jgi:signal transduction histidine kinase
MRNTIQDEFAEIVSLFPFPMLKCDVEGKVVFMNAPCNALLDQMNVTDDNLRDFIENHFHDVLALATKTGETQNQQSRFADRTLDFIFKAAPCGEVFVFLYDLKDREDAKEKLFQSEKMASLAMLVAGVAHEINTPIGSINSGNDLIRDSVKRLRECTGALSTVDDAGRLDECYQLLEILEDIGRTNAIAIERITHVVRNLKNFARLDEAERKKVNIHDGLDSTLLLLRHQFRNRIQIAKQYSDVPEIECFPNALNQAFMNLIVNAAQAIGDKGTITIRTLHDDTAVRVVISDTGEGIAPECLPKIFDPGFTTKGVGVGSGLGLSICYKIIQQHQGAIEATSEVGQGSTFTITLPLTRPE